MVPLGSAALVGCAETPDDNEELVDETLPGNGKADDGRGFTIYKPNRCSVVCGASPAYAAIQALYCEPDTGLLPSWLNPFSGWLVDDEPPIPEFVAYSLVGDEKINLSSMDGWEEVDAEAYRASSTEPLSETSDTNPNKWSLDSLTRSFYVSEEGAGGWAAWPLTIPEGDAGESWSLYAYVPPGGSSTAARYRVYNGIDDEAALSHTVDQTQYSRGAEIVLFDHDYHAPGWHFLGRTVLYEGASVSLDPGAEGGAFADTVLAVRWGCKSE